MNMKNEDEIVVVIEKATQVAFCSLRKLHCTPFNKPDGRVAFKVKGNVNKVLAEFHTNPKINILDYLQRLDAVRSLIFTLKSNGGRQRKKDREKRILGNEI